MALLARSSAYQRAEQECQDDDGRRKQKGTARAAAAKPGRGA